MGITVKENSKNKDKTGAAGGTSPGDLEENKAREEVLDSGVIDAIAKGNLEDVERWTNSCANLDAVDRNGWTALHHAVMEGDIKIVEKLIGAGANVNAKFYNDTTTPVDPEVFSVQEGILKELIKEAAIADTDDIWKEVEAKKRVVFDFTPLHIASRNGHIEVVEKLIDKGADVNVKVIFDLTPLHFAICKGNLKIVEKLIKEKANVNAVDKNGSTALYHAVRKGDITVVEKLIDKGADVNAAAILGATPLHCASAKGNLKIVKKLIDAGANVNAKIYNDTKTPLTPEVFSIQKDILKALMKEAAISDTDDIWKEVEAKQRVVFDFTPLQMASGSGYIEVVAKLIEEKADVNAKAIFDLTPLHFASWYGHIEVVEKLIDKGADVNAKDSDGRTALAFARQISAQDKNKDKQEKFTKIIKILSKYEEESNEVDATRS